MKFNMDYNYELLSGEQFRLLCQFLLARQYPSAQYISERMLDSGRDAIVDGSKRPTLIFEVKYAHNPAMIDDAAGWSSQTCQAPAASVQEA